MKRENNGALLSTVFVDYDNIYLSLKRKSEDAAKRFAKDAPLWLAELVSGRLITPTNGPSSEIPRRIVMNRCYGNPVPRRNNADNSTDMNSFPFVRHHFLRSGFEVVDCPPLTAQLKNSSDIRMVMDVRDYLNHDTYFDEFIILSGDADFTPLLHRLRAHARRTVIFANDYTAAPYTAISDGEVREQDLIQLLLDGRMLTAAEANDAASARAQLPGPADIEETRRSIVKEVVEAVRSAGQPVPLEALADRAVRNLGHERTVGSSWGGSGTFRDLLLKALPSEVQLNDQPPYFVFETGRQIPAEPQRARIAEDHRSAAPAPAPARLEPQAKHADHEPSAPAIRPEPHFDPRLEARPEHRLAPRTDDLRADHFRAEDQRLAQQADPQARPAAQMTRDSAAAEYAAARQGLPPTTAIERPVAPQRAAPAIPPAVRAPAPQPHAPQGHALQGHAPQVHAQPSQAQHAPQPAAAPQRPAAESGATSIQRSIARIHEACQAPPLSPPEYRALFDVIAEDITRKGFNGATTLASITQRANEMGIEIRRDDIRFILDVVSETDPWFEQGASQRLFAGRFRNFVVARCRSQGLSLSADELDLIDAWFAGGPSPSGRAQPREENVATAAGDAQANRQWDVQQPTAQADRFGTPDDLGGDEFPRIVRRGLR
ncbi:MAG: NYN domain-containing protein [Hyphomicrobiaceae bacterium]|nr:NYN domain-containing protein [Hyphomicrobiaceae bacterium]